MSTILTGLIQGALGLAAAYTLIALCGRHARRQAARTWLRAVAAAQTQPLDDTKPGRLDDTYHHLEHLYNAPAATKEDR